MCIKELQDKCVAEERVINHLGKHNETLTNKQAQYKEAARILNKKVEGLKKKLTEEASLREKAEKEKVYIEKELTALIE